jgi:prepilin-type N-terminal cleavage/methylation domain-containing protein
LIFFQGAPVESRLLSSSRMRAVAPGNGFSLLEVLFATAILTVAVMSLAQVVAIAARANASARTAALATMLGAQKMEQLRALAWTFRADGDPVSDTTTGGVGLSASPPDALDRDVEGYSDWLDASGRTVLRATAATFVRRWSIAPLPSRPDTLVLQVIVAVVGRQGAAAALVTVKTRKGP